MISNASRITIASIFTFENILHKHLKENKYTLDNIFFIQIGYHNISIRRFLIVTKQKTFPFYCSWERTMLWSW